MRGAGIAGSRKGITDRRYRPSGERQLWGRSYRFQGDGAKSGFVKGFRTPASHRAEGLHGGRRYEAALDPPDPPRARRRPVEPDYDHPLLTPLVRAQDAVARLEASAEMASDAVAEGLRAPVTSRGGGPL
jgi:hypothetical protein